MSLGGVGFYSLTTTVAPGAGTKIGAHEEIILGDKVYYQGIVVGFISAGGIFCPVGPATPLPVFAETEPGTASPLFYEAAVQSGENTVPTLVVAASKRLVMNRLTLSCQYEGCLRLKVNGTTRRSIRTGPGQPTVAVDIDPNDAASGDTVTLTHEPRNGVPASALVAAALDARLVDA